jgi:HlyD family secretion protein
MANPNRLFSKDAVERSLSPDNLERLMPVIGAKDWLMIATVGALLVLFSVWAVLGRVPVVASGRGVILRPHQVVPIQTEGAGRVLSISWRPGDRIHAGDVVATLDQSELRKRIREDGRSLETLEAQDSRKTAAENEELASQLQQDKLERTALEAQRTTLLQSLADAKTLKPILEGHAESNRKLVKEGLLGYAAHELSDSETAAREIDAKIYDFTSRLSQVDGQIQQIQTRASTLARQFLEGSTARRNEIALVRRNIDMGELQIERDGSIHSQYSGRVAEVMTAAGQVLPQGGRLLTIDADEAGPELVSISYFPVRDGKKIQPGMHIQITPDTVQRERFGGIVGTVSSVSPIPITKEGATGIIGNTELVQSLMPEGAYIEVRAQLQADPRAFSGYRWSSSRGPDMKLTSGLTHSTRVTLDGRAPISYFLPSMREASGVY